MTIIREFNNKQKENTQILESIKISTLRWNTLLNK
jgi:hypothetical protein